MKKVKLSYLVTSRDGGTDQINFETTYLIEANNNLDAEQFAKVALINSESQYFYIENIKVKFIKDIA